MDSIYYYISLIIESKGLCFIALIVILICFLIFKLTFWKRQGIPNNISHNYKIFNKVMTDHDWNCIKTYGKVVGYVYMNSNFIFKNR